MLDARMEPGTDTDPTLILCTWRDLPGERTVDPSESRFRRVLEQVQLIGASLAARGRLIFANNCLLTLTGRPGADILGRDWLSACIAPQNQDAARDAFQRTMTGENAWEYVVYEAALLTRNGRTLDVGWTNVPVRNGQGRIIGVNCVGLDITERKRALTALHESEGRFQALFAGSPLGIYLLRLEPDDTLVLLAANPASSRIMNRDNSRLVGLPVHQAFPYAVGSILVEHYIRLARDGGAWSLARYEQHAGGRTMFFDIHAFQTAPRHVAVMFQDVTAQVHASDALRENEALYRSLFENSAAGIFLMGPDCVVREANSLACEMLGYGRDEMQGMHARDILAPASAAPLPPEEAARRARQTARPLTFQRECSREAASLLPVESHVRAVDDGATTWSCSRTFPPACGPRPP
jgi:PAS domain S-box-containing protein